VFATGIVLLVAGPSARSPFLGLHKASFLIWLAFMALHVLGHLPELPHSLRASSRERATPWDDYGAGRGARALALAGSLAAGVILAILTIPLFASWAHSTSSPLSPAPASLSFEALGGVATVATTVAGELDAAVAVVKAEVRAIDVTASRFRADSEIERLNARAGEP